MVLCRILAIMTLEQDFPEDANNIEKYNQQVVEILALIDKSCPDSPFHPDSPEFWYAVESGENEELLAGKYYFWSKEHLTKAGTLKKEYEKEFYSMKIPCLDCKEILHWDKAIGYNNHRHIVCTNCRWHYHE